MTKADLVDRVCQQIGPGLTRRDCQRVVDSFLSAVKDSLGAGEHIEIRGFGTFKVRDRAGRMARNPRTGEAVPVESRGVPSFKPSRELRKTVEDGPAEGG